MNKGRMVIVVFIALALLTALGFILGYQTGRTLPPGAAVVPRPNPIAPAPQADPVTATAAPNATAVSSPTMLDAASARRAAIRILKGDPYGRTDAEVDGNIRSQSLERNENRTAWVFAIKTDATGDYPDGIEGTLIIDAADGSLITAGLPFLD